MPSCPTNVPPEIGSGPRPCSLMSTYHGGERGERVCEAEGGGGERRKGLE